jgi:extradiol dioxygenase family protein
MPLPEDWRAFIESLNSNGAEYVVVEAGRVEAPVGETRVNFIGRKEPTRNKRHAGRAQDRADLEAPGEGRE